ncbi:MAG: oligosaccharide flippase family protein [Candidatus Paceibacterota bacterium]
MISILKKSAFIKDVTTLSSGIIAANLITIAASLFLTRLYTPEEIGFLTFLNSAAIVLANVFSLGYELAVVTPKNNSTAIRLVLGAFYLIAFFSIILLGIVLVLLWIGFVPNIGLPGEWLIYLPFAVLFLGCFNIAQEWFNRTKNYKLLSYTKVIQSLGTALPQILIGYFFLNKIGLVLGFVFGRFISSAIFIWNFMKDKIFTIYSYSNVFRTLKNYIRYPKYISPTLILDRISLEAPYFLISIFFSENLLGFFAISYRVLSVPLSFIGAAIGQVFFKTLATKKNKLQKLAPPLVKTWLYLAILGIVPMGIIMAGGAPLFEFVFGDEWGFSGTLAVLLIPMLYLDFISSPTGRSFLVLKLEHYTPFFSVARLTCVAGSLYIGYIYESILLGILLLSLTRALTLVIQNLILYLKAKQYDAS